MCNVEVDFAERHALGQAEPGGVREDIEDAMTRTSHPSRVTLKRILPNGMP